MQLLKLLCIQVIITLLDNQVIILSKSMKQKLEILDQIEKKDLVVINVQVMLLVFAFHLMVNS